MQNSYKDRVGSVDLLGIGLLAAAPFFLLFLAINLIKFACSSKQSFIFCLCVGGLLVLSANLPKVNITIDLPEGVMERLELKEQK